MTNLSNIVEILAKQALGSNSNQHQSQQSGGLGGILGSVLGQLGNNHQQSTQSQQGGLGGILGSVMGQFGGSSQGLGGSSKTSLLVAVLPLVLAWIQKQGGLQGALDKLKGQGLSSQVDDWVSTGPGENASVNPQEVQNLFDDEEVEQVAQQTHAAKQDIYGAISQVLPQIIDSLTPQGEQTSKTEANNDIQNVLNMVSGFLKR
ncbi:MULTISPECIES: YidB family protein [unclassified Acinetobacter]|uniref:YidB family protein n=1 Tax=unclassified Acinetobacter TaxID=196816 RepID=UPI0015D32D65|nr:MULTISPECIES: YidB family protein [unclassified Acinetobacter]